MFSVEVVQVFQCVREQLFDHCGQGLSTVWKESNTTNVEYSQLKAHHTPNVGRQIRGRSPERKRGHIPHPEILELMDYRQTYVMDRLIE